MLVKLLDIVNEHRWDTYECYKQIKKHLLYLPKNSDKTEYKLNNSFLIKIWKVQKNIIDNLTKKRKNIIDTV